MKHFALLTVTMLICTGLASAQPDHKSKVPPATTADVRLDGFAQRQKLEENSMVSNLEFRSVGPTIMSGRVTDIAVDPADPTHFFVAYASGGLWETRNNGISFEPLFDQEAVMTIGDIAVNWTTNAIWVGTGENNSSRSSYSGTGLYRSTDGGATWQHIGLADSHHIGRIVLHPTKPDVAWVAVLGHLYSPSTERGVYMTTDGGQSWSRKLDSNPNTGAIDLVIGDRTSDDPKVLYASLWDRERRAWNFRESGAGSGIYKSVDGGLSWQKISGGNSGFPSGDGVGRIGLAVASDDGNDLYAFLDNQFRKPKSKEDEEDKLTKARLKEMTEAQFLALETGEIEGFLRDNGFPDKYTGSGVQKKVKKGLLKHTALVEYLEDSNSLLFDTPVLGAELYRSKDGGKTWQKTHNEELNDIYYSYGYYFGVVSTDPANGENVYVAGVPILRSQDGGKSFESINGDNVHVDHHVIWVNPNRPGHLINGNDGGINISYDNGDTWFKANAPAVGQFYTVAFDYAKPYNIYGGLQDNGVWKGSSTYRANRSWHQEGTYPYRRIMGGDGMQIAIDSRDNNTVYTGFQFGNYFRLNARTRAQQSITPRHELGERPLRFNWQTPIHLSLHNEDILYMGSNKFHRSMKQGEAMQTLSGDLTKGGKKGDVSYGTLSSIHESPMRFGLIYVGSDDGLIHVTKDGGYTWENISEQLPEDLWVSRVWASGFEEGTVYASLNGYRWDNFKAYVYKSTDYGKSWAQIGLDLPAEPVNVIKEDPVNPNLLYVGTDHGVYISLDQGQRFMRMSKGMPAVAVHDLAIHPRDHDLIVGTHGRSIYIAPVEHLQQLNDEVLAHDLHVFEPEEVRHSSSWGRSWSKWIEGHGPEREFAVYAKSAGKGTFSVSTENGLQLYQQEIDLSAGLNFPRYNLSVDEKKVKAFEKELNKDRSKDEAPVHLEKAENELYYLPVGTYTVAVSANGKQREVKLEVK